MWWNAPILYPLEGALALSETFLGLAPITSPLLWVGLDAVSVYNLTFLLAIVASAVSAHALALRLTGRTTRH